MKLINSNITKHLPQITLDYINNEDRVIELFERENLLENYFDQILDKKNNYNNNFRKPLVDVLSLNYEKVSKNSLQIQSIRKLNNNNTYTVTTGHQLNLFTGPLYFFYKIMHNLNIYSSHHAGGELLFYHFFLKYWRQDLSFHFCRKNQLE